MSHDGYDPRLDRIVSALVAYAKHDFSHRVKVSDALDVIDAVAGGLNMMAEELDGAVASRRELVAAYEALQEAQVKLVHAAKLASIGQLASGVAHEVNNPAGWASLALVLAKKRSEEIRREVAASGSPGLPERLKAKLDELDEVLASATEGVERIRAVASDLRTFSRVDGDATEHVFLDDVIRATSNLLSPAIRTETELVLELGDVPPVRGSRGRLGQVVANLVVNATRAVRSAKGAGKIVVRTSSAGSQVTLNVEDNGGGVPEDLRERIFDPFFTTDPAGTGLGLSLVLEIVTQHGGQVRVTSSSLGGARFEVTLPCAAPLP